MPLNDYFHWWRYDEGQFPVPDTGADGFAGLAPVAQFPPNGYGSYDLAGNVWQWCSDWYRPGYYARLKLAGAVVVRNPQGPASSDNPGDDQPQRVHRGGSFLCTDEYCTRYMMSKRGKRGRGPRQQPRGLPLRAAGTRFTREQSVLIDAAAMPL